VLNTPFTSIDKIYVNGVERIVYTYDTASRTLTFSTVIPNNHPVQIKGKAYSAGDLIAFPASYSVDNGTWNYDDT